MTEPAGGPRALLAGAQAAVPVAVGYAGIGFAAGVIGAQAGLSPAEVTLLSLIVFAGSAQFVFAELYTGSAVTLFVTTFLINLRHLLYATAFTPRVRGLGMPARFWIGAQLTDETFSLATSLLRGAVPGAGWMIALNMTSYLAWTCGNLAGALTGGAAGSIEWLGIEFALAAMFAALLMLQVDGPVARRLAMTVVAGLAAGTMIGLELWNPHPLNLLAATVVAATAGAVLFPAVKTEPVEEAP